jgi:long-chain acyl-CoA synthetase
MSYTRLFDILPYQLEKYPQGVAFGTKVNGKWETYSTQESIDIVNRVSYGLMSMGIRKNDKIAIISINRPEWNFMDLGILQLSANDVPVYPTISMSDYEYIFNEAGIKYCFVGTRELYDKVKPLLKLVPTLKEIYTFDKIDGVPFWKDMLKDGDEEQIAELEKIKASVVPNDLATLIYTSGTTGLPKGVMLSHHNLVSNVEATLSGLPITHEHTVLSFLPLCHSFERMVTYTYMAIGASIYYAESMETIGEDLKDVKPHFFTSVPRLLEKVYDKIMAKGNALTGIKKKLFFWAIDLGLKYDYRGRSAWYNFQLAIANKLIFSKWREALGGRIIGIVTGAAALQERLARIFTAGNIPVKEGYGLTETSPVLSYNRFNEVDACFGTVGIPIPGVEIKLAEDGEILAKGPNIMLGYYKKPDETKAVFNEDGWFLTGDIGQWVEGRFLKIIDRKKELYKTSGGKYVAPQPLENRFKESPLIEQIMVLGDDLKFVSALIVPSFDNLKAFCEENGIEADSLEEMIANENVYAAYEAILDEFNPAFSNTEQIKKIKLLPDEWTEAGGELTPTMKVKRKVILEKYADAIREIYES